MRSEGGLKSGLLDGASEYWPYRARIRLSLKNPFCGIHASIHKVDERVSLDELERLPALFREIAEKLLLR
jgi:hypothetical protein